LKLLLQPLPIRIFHWTLVAAVSTLVLTGLYLDNPVTVLHFRMGTVRYVHLLAAMVLIVNVFGQMYYYIYTRKFTEVIFLPRDLQNLRSFSRYYMFITNETPNYGRYNPGQKALYTVWLAAILLSIVCGIALLFPDDTVWLQKTMHGLNTIRIIKYFIGMLFVGTIPLHLYLVFTEDPAKLQAMFTGYIKKEPKCDPAQHGDTQKEI